ncbi:YacL family protein [Marinobacterium aestuariivivens]|uniref:YacL family protein n=1 Tax=Marinobacterium aestuariivivens TaxID=1698799 RepID=A0ABW2A1F6_9GAMM
MDYTVGRDELGRYFAEFSMGQEAIGRWLSEELGSDLPSLEQLLETIAGLQQRQLRDYRLDGREFRLELDREEARIRAHSLDHDADGFDLEDLDYYDEELEAGCGLDDFNDVLVAWRELIAG